MRYCVGKPTIENILSSNLDKDVKDFPIVIKALRIAGVLTEIKKNMSCSALLNQLNINDPEVLRKTIVEIMKPEQKGMLHDCKSVAMWFMLILMSISYTGTNIYNSIKTGIQIPWEDMILPLLAPLMVVLQERGIVSRENREMLATLAGNNPALTIMEALSQRIANGPASKSIKNQRKKNVEEETIVDESRNLE